MKKIENIQVTVTYSVELNDIEVPDEVYEGLVNGWTFDSEAMNMTKEESAAMDWIEANIEETDATEWRYEVDDIN